MCGLPRLEDIWGSEGFVAFWLMSIIGPNTTSLVEFEIIPSLSTIAGLCPIPISLLLPESKFFVLVSNVVTFAFPPAFDESMIVALNTAVL